MKKIVLFALCMAAGAAARAQDSDTLTTAIQADVVSQYIWRGQECGNVSLQPTLGIAWKGLSLTAWGSVGLTDSDDTKEFDLTAAYTVGGLTVGVTDYWFSTGLDPQGRYFRYDAHQTNHVFEASVGYDFKVLSVQWCTSFAGNDGTNRHGRRAYSSYFETSVPFSLGGAKWEAVAAAVPYATTLYGTSGFAVTNLSVKAVKDIPITEKFSIPIFGQVVANPCSQKAYLVLGLTLQP